MALEQYKNQAVTTLNGAIDDLVTSISVTDGSVFPSNGDFRIVIDTEIMTCTARTGNSLTVTRATEGSVATNHNDGSNVAHCLTAGAMYALIEKMVQYGPASSKTNQTTPGGIYLSNTNGLFRYDGTGYQQYINPMKIKHPGVLADWTDLTGSTASSTTYEEADTDLGFYLRANGGSTAVRRVKARIKAIPSPPRSLTVGLYQYSDSGTALGTTGIILYNSSTNQTICFGSYWRLDNAAYSIGLRNYYTPSFVDSVTISTLTVDQYNVGNGPIFIKVVDNGTTITYNFSQDNIYWVQVAQEATNARMTPSDWGVGVFMGGVAQYAMHVFHIEEGTS